MTEDFLHYIWKFRLFNSTELKTAGGQSLVIFQPGQHNFNGGPDFLNSRIKIGEETWSGHVEIHMRGSDWHRHGHTDDGHYKNVILHVVFNNDKEIFLTTPGDLPVMDMSNYMITDQWTHYEKWLQSKTWIPCQSQVPTVDQLTWTSWKDRLIIERLEQKSTAFNEQLKKTNGDWHETFYRRLARNFGFKVNADAMEMLAESLPQQILARHRSDPLQVEALLFGQAGFLDFDLHDEYPSDLKKEYSFLQKKYLLRPMNPAAWNFARMRPANFPTIRLAQFAALVCQAEHLFSQILETEDMRDILRLFEVEAHLYWSSHFRFDVPSIMETEDFGKKGTKKMGRSSIENILVNTVVTALFHYGRVRSDEKYIDKALKLLEICAPEDNRIVQNWSKLGIRAESALDAQSLLQLYNLYCSEKRCLQCQVGLKLLKP